MKDKNLYSLMETTFMIHTQNAYIGDVKIKNHKGEDVDLSDIIYTIAKPNEGYPSIIEVLIDEIHESVKILISKDYLGGLFETWRSKDYPVDGKLMMAKTIADHLEYLSNSSKEKKK